MFATDIRPPFLLETKTGGADRVAVGGQRPLRGSTRRGGLVPRGQGDLQGPRRGMFVPTRVARSGTPEATNNFKE